MGKGTPTTRRAARKAGRSHARHFTTSQVADIAGTHPNTVRLYEKLGFLRRLPRSAGGYRLFSKGDVDQMCFARTALNGGWPGRDVRESAIALVRRAVSGDLCTALDQARQHLGLVQAERKQAEDVAAFLARWAHGEAVPAGPGCPRRIGDVAREIGLSPDSLRGWERDGLLRVDRDDHGYRLYGTADVSRLHVIRLLLRAGYSSMAVLRMFLRLDSGEAVDVRNVLDTPRPDEDALTAADRWLTFLAEQEQRAAKLVQMLTGMASTRA
ncbi:MAG TPA: MerR family transcriptional regulator [Clostridia bacterium]|nr:MerR family transcriptional regulator [Clostridia bacterium]